MLKRCNILLTCFIIIALCFLASGCGAGTVFDKTTGASLEFPLEADGYPREGVALINGETFELKNYGNIYHGETGEGRLSVKAEGGVLEIAVANGGAVTGWRVSDNVGLQSCSEYEPESVNDIKDGASGVVQRFVLRVPSERTEIVLKHINTLSAAGKTFDELEYDYQLIITVEP